MLDFEEYADGIARAAVVLHANAVRAGLDAVVPTCPGWTVRDLLAHQGMVHRWATAIVAGANPRDVDTEALEKEGLGAVDLVDWVDDGVDSLLRTLDDADPEGEVWFFLADPPAPRLGWSRRQCHETTVHAVDALAAALGRVPSADEVWFGRSLAADGVDELLTGFLPRPRTTFRLPHPLQVSVVPDDRPERWVMDLGPDGATTRRGEYDEPQTVLRGSAVALYLGLWNRGSEIREEGEPLLVTWGDGQKVRW